MAKDSFTLKSDVGVLEKPNSSKWIEGKVRWFDDLRGEGLVRDKEGNSYYVHYSSIISTQKHKTLTEGKKVKFILLEDSDFTCVLRVKEVN